MLERCRPRHALGRVVIAGLGLAVCALAVIGAPAAGAGPLERSRAQAREVAGQVAALDVSIDQAVLRYAKATRELDEVRAAIRQNKRRHALAQYELDLSRSMLAERAIVMYKNQELTSLDLVFSADDFDELVDQLFLFRQVQRNDSATVSAFRLARDELEQRTSILTDELRTARRLVEARAAEYESIRGQLAQRRALLAGANARTSRLAAEKSRTVAADQPSAQPPGDQGGGSGPWWPLIERAASANGVSARGMYRLMMIESGGSATIVGAGGFHGLFQYAPSTWKGSWNPYRSQGITDGAAQIRATALALRLGKGPFWWGNSYAWAFGDG